MLVYGVAAATIVVALAALLIRPPPMQAGGFGGIRSVPSARVLGMAPNTALALIAAASFLCCVPMAVRHSALRDARWASRRSGVGGEAAPGWADGASICRRRCSRSATDQHMIAHAEPAHHPARTSLA